LQRGEAIEERHRMREQTRRESQFQQGSVDLSHDRDRGRRNDVVTRTTLVPLHLYL
jgi:hypothetical protein